MRFRLLALPLLLLALAAAPAARAQKASLSGYVTDAATGETLLLANVLVDGTAVGAATNMSGYYVVSGLEPGTYTFVASYLGYESQRREVTLAPGEERRLDFALSAGGFGLEEVVVTADEDDEERRAVGATRLTTELVQQLPAVFEADVFRSLQLLPGIKAASDFSSGLYVRGGSPDQTMILLDRTVVYNPTHVFGFFSTFNPDALKDVQVYKGGYPAPYGGRLGAVLDLYNKDGNRERTSGKLSLGLLASRASVEGPYRALGTGGSYMLAVRRSTLEPVLAALRESEEGIPETFYFYDVNAKLNVDAGPSDKLSIAVYGGADDLRMEPGEDFRMEMTYGNRTASATWTHLFSPTVFTNLTVTGSRYYSLPVFTFAETDFRRRNRVYDVSAKGDLEWAPNGRHGVAAGFWAGNLTLRLQDHYDGEDTFGSRIQALYGAAYVQDTWRPSTRWMVQGGLRVSAFAEGGYVRLEPRLSAEHRPTDALRLQAAYGRYTQPLTLITSEAFSGLDVWLTAADGVAPAWGDQFVVGAKTALSAAYRLDVEAYYRTMEDLFELDPNIQDAAGLDYADLFRVGDGYAYGTEVTLEKGTGRVTGFAGYTFGRTRRRFATANEGRWYPPKYDRTHDVALVANVALARSWKATAAFTYATGQAYTEPLARTRYEGPFSARPTDVTVIGRVNASRLPAYHRLDVGVTKTGRLGAFAGYELQLQIINAYNRRNVWFYQYDLDENPVEMETIRMLPVLPNLSYTLSF